MSRASVKARKLLSQLSDGMRLQEKKTQLHLQGCFLHQELPPATKPYRQEVEHLLPCR